MLHASQQPVVVDSAESSPAARPENSPPQPVIVMVQSGRQTVLWVVALVVAVIATAALSRQDRSLLPAAFAQNAAGVPQFAGARGIYAFTGQITPKSYGLFMMDVDTGTVWCYELQHGPNGEPQMKLVAARSWIYDRYLEEFNVSDPVPSAVKVLIDQQRKGPGNPGPAAAPAPAPTGSGAGAGVPAVPAPAGRQ